MPDTPAASPQPEVCTACDHDIDLHYTSVRGVVVCRATQSGVSDHGIVGMPWTRSCDCRNYVSPQMARWRKEKADEEAERRKRMDDIVSKVNWKEKFHD